MQDQVRGELVELVQFGLDALHFGVVVGVDGAENFEGGFAVGRGVVDAV